jgi:hypothetical protein
MASFQNFKDNALSYLAIALITGVGYKINVLDQKVDRLMEVSAGTVVRIEGLEREVFKTVYNIHTPVPPYKLPLQVKMNEVVAVINKNDLTPKKYETFN